MASIGSSIFNLLKSSVRSNLHLIGIMRYSLAGVVFLLPVSFESRPRL